VIVNWFMTYWCNYNCDICHMPHDREAGHCFDYASPEKWVEAFRRIRVPYGLYITGGEPFLDAKRFRDFYCRLVQERTVTRIRIDTNLSIPVRLLQPIEPINTFLNVSYHPEYTSLDKLLQRIDEYEKVGFQIAMINYVCKPDEVSKFLKLRKYVEDRGYFLNPGIYEGGVYPKRPREVESYAKVVDKADIMMKCKVLSPRGLRCRGLNEFLLITPNGNVYNCLGHFKGSILNPDFEVRPDVSPTVCNANECTCISKYAFLESFPGQADHTLMDYVKRTKKVITKRRNREIITFVGYFGYGNLGDEALLASCLERLQKLENVLPVVIAFGDAEWVQREHQVFAVSGTNIEQVANVVKLSDAVILGPGGLLDDYAQPNVHTLYNGTPEGMYRYLYPILLAQQYGRKTLAYGLGVGPLNLEESKYAVRHAMTNLDKIYLRSTYDRYPFDEPSIKKKIEIISDPALNLRSTSFVPRGMDINMPRGIKNTIGISIRSLKGLENYSDEETITEITVVVSWLLQNTDFNIVLIPMDYSIDYPILRSIKEKTQRISNERRINIWLPREHYSPREVLGLIENCSLIIGMRLHSLVLAANVGVPFVAIEYHPKVGAFARSVGMEDYLISVKELCAERVIQKVIELCQWGIERTNQYTVLVTAQKELETAAYNNLLDYLFEN